MICNYIYQKSVISKAIVLQTKGHEKSPAVNRTGGILKCFERLTPETLFYYW